MGTKLDKSCAECDGDGYVWDYLGGCGDPKCCGGPWKVKCHSCDNDWGNWGSLGEDFDLDFSTAASETTR